jgi:hypothetical protein
MGCAGEMEVIDYKEQDVCERLFGGRQKQLFWGQLESWILGRTELGGSRRAVAAWSNPTSWFTRSRMLSGIPRYNP